MILNIKKHALFASEGAQVFLRTDAEATQSKDLSLRIFVIFEDVHELFTPRDSGHFRATYSSARHFFRSYTLAAVQRLGRCQAVCFPLELPFFFNAVVLP
jgi:hypothetical protein